MRPRPREPRPAAWLRTTPPRPEPAPPLRPSSALGAADAGSPGRATGLSRRSAPRGRLSCSCCSCCPEPRPSVAGAGARLWAARAPRFDAGKRRPPSSPTLWRCWRMSLAALFGPGIRAERRRRRGRDRIRRPPGVGPDRPAGGARRRGLLADFKTRRGRPGTSSAPRAYVAQLAVYRALLARDLSGPAGPRSLIWTAGPLTCSSRRPGAGRMPSLAWIQGQDAELKLRSHRALTLRPLRSIPGARFLFRPNAARS